MRAGQPFGSSYRLIIVIEVRLTETALYEIVLYAIRLLKATTKGFYSEIEKIRVTKVRIMKVRQNLHETFPEDCFIAARIYNIVQKSKRA